MLKYRSSYQTQNSHRRLSYVYVQSMLTNYLKIDRSVVKHKRTSFYVMGTRYVSKHAIIGILFKFPSLFHFWVKFTFNNLLLPFSLIFCLRWFWVFGQYRIAFNIKIKLWWVQYFHFLKNVFLFIDCFFFALLGIFNNC